MTENTNEGPVIEVIPLAEQLANHDEYQPDTTDDLAGMELSLHLADGTVLDVRFDSADELTWKSDRELIPGDSGRESYEAFLVRSGLYGIVVARLDEHLSALVILDLDGRRVIINATRFVDGSSGRIEETNVHQAGIGGPIEQPFPLTTELVGK